MQVSVRRVRVRSMAVVVGALVAITALIASPTSSSADEYETPMFVEWSSLLPSFDGTYDPTSSGALSYLEASGELADRGAAQQIPDDIHHLDKEEQAR